MVGFRSSLKHAERTQKNRLKLIAKIFLGKLSVDDRFDVEIKKLLSERLDAFILQLLEEFDAHFPKCTNPPMKLEDVPTMVKTEGLDLTFEIPIKKSDRTYYEGYWREQNKAPTLINTTCKIRNTDGAPCILFFKNKIPEEMLDKWTSKVKAEEMVAKTVHDRRGNAFISKMKPLGPHLSINLGQWEEQGKFVGRTTPQSQSEEGRALIEEIQPISSLISELIETEMPRVAESYKKLPVQNRPVSNIKFW
jgi:hypothetical protein